MQLTLLKTIFEKYTAAVQLVFFLLGIDIILVVLLSLIIPMKPNSILKQILGTAQVHRFWKRL